jgi:peptidyl-prolyl cis-trans isomerase C
MAPQLHGKPELNPEPPASAPLGSDTGPKPTTAVRRWLREPLLHSLVAGALIFAIYQLLNPTANLTDRANQIVLTKDDLRQLAVHWLAQGRPLPTADQMHALIEQRISEEVLSREAVALGLDRDDEIIKRRLAQKMDFLAADIAALQDPGDAELRVWYTQNSDRFALSPRASFRHLYFSFDRPGARDRAVGILDKISGKPADAPEVVRVADPFMFQDYYAERAPDQIAKEFGPGFAKAVFQLKPGAWQGPIQSGYGWHLVFVSTIEPGRVPAFEEVEADVKSAWLDQKQREIKRIAFEAMRARYTVVVPPIESVDFGSLRNPQAPIASRGVSPQ